MALCQRPVVPHLLGATELVFDRIPVTDSAVLRAGPQPPPCSCVDGPCHGRAGAQHIPFGAAPRRTQPDRDGCDIGGGHAGSGTVPVPLPDEPDRPPHRSDRFLGYPRDQSPHGAGSPPRGAGYDGEETMETGQHVSLQAPRYQSPASGLRIRPGANTPNDLLRRPGRAVEVRSVASGWTGHFRVMMRSSPRRPARWARM